MTVDREFFEKTGMGGPAVPAPFPIFDTSASQLEMWSRCDRRFYYRYVQGFVPISVPENMVWGTFWHRIIQEYYRAIQKGLREDTALHAAQLIAEQCTLVENKLHGGTQVHFDAEKRERIWDTIRYYYDQVARMDDWDEIVAVEESIYFVVGYQGNPVMRIRSTMDLVARKDGRLCPVDHKTTGDVQKSLAFLAMDLQVKIYMLTAFAFYEQDPYFCYNMVARDVPPGFGHRSLLTETGRKRSPETLEKMQRPENYLHREWISKSEREYGAIQRDLVKKALMIHFAGNSGMWERRIVKMGGMSCETCPYFAICAAEFEGQKFDENSPAITMMFTKDPFVAGGEAPKPTLYTA